MADTWRSTKTKLCMVVEKKSVLIPFIFQVTRKMQAYKLMGYTGNLTEYVQLTLSIIHSSNRAT